MLYNFMPVNSRRLLLFLILGAVAPKFNGIIEIVLVTLIENMGFVLNNILITAFILEIDWLRIAIFFVTNYCSPVQGICYLGFFRVFPKH